MRFKALSRIALGAMMAHSAFAALDFNSKPSAVTFLQGGLRYKYVFAVSNGQLYYREFIGSTWQPSWQPLGLPPAATKIGYPHAVTYQDGAGLNHILVFVITNSNHLAMKNWNGSGWSWEDHGVVPTGSVPNNGPWPLQMSVITYPSNGFQNTWVFMFPDNNSLNSLKPNLWANYWNNFQRKWVWTEVGLPPGATPSLSTEQYLSAVTYVDPATGIRNTSAFVFVPNSDHLWRAVGYNPTSLSGYQTFYWDDCGAPPSRAGGWSPVAVAVQDRNLGELVYVYVLSWLNGQEQIFVYVAQGGGWQRVGYNNQSPEFTAVTYTNFAGSQPLLFWGDPEYYGSIYGPTWGMTMTFWNGAQWVNRLVDASFVGFDAITYQTAVGNTIQYWIDVYMIDSLGHLTLESSINPLYGNWLYTALEAP